MGNLNLNNNKGITLVELMATLAILSIVIAMILALQLFGIKIFHKNGNQSDLQSDLRITADRISTEIRYAENSQIFTSVTIFDNQYKYIYLDTSDHLVKYRVGNGTPMILIGENGTVGLTFTRKADHIIGFLVSETISGQMFSLDSEINLLNLRANSLIGTTGSVLRFGPISDIEVVTTDADDLTLGITETSGNVVLPLVGSAGSTVTWTLVGSSPYATVSGTLLSVTRPPMNIGDVTITLRATITKNAEFTTKDIVLIIKAIGLESVTMDVAAGTLNNTSTQMLYKVGANNWTTASAVTTNVNFGAGGDVLMSNFSHTLQMTIGTILAPAVPPNITMEEVRNKQYLFKLNGAIITGSLLEYKMDASAWTTISDGLEVTLANNKTYVFNIRVKATRTVLPSQNKEITITTSKN